MLLSTPRLVIAGLAGDSGKTLVALGVARAPRAARPAVAPFKKGPDYIDAAWLGAAAGAPGRNLDTFMMIPEAIGAGAGARRCRPTWPLIEGNRGLFDGFDAAGSHSTAELAKLLGAPVVLVVDVTKMTRTAAALVLGCAALDPDLNLAGVLLNRVGTARQERVIRDAIAGVGGPPVLGALPRLGGRPACPDATWAWSPRPSTRGGTRPSNGRRRPVETHVDLDALLDAARSAPPSTLPDELRHGRRLARSGSASFVTRRSASTTPRTSRRWRTPAPSWSFVSPLRDGALPEVDALYFGGGFPEVHVDRLAGEPADARSGANGRRRAACRSTPSAAG